MTWDADFMRRSPMFAPLARNASVLGTCSEWPERSVLQSLLTKAGVTNVRGIALRLVAPSPSGRYETDIYERGDVATREGQWHDFFNVLAWVTYPRAKAALNARHVEALKRPEDRGAGKRGRVQDALTVLDESGAVFASADEELIADLRAFRWHELFWTKRRRFIESARVFIFGHALFEKALAPYVGLTAHALPLLVGAEFVAQPLHRQLEIVDGCVAESIAALGSPRELAPLPLLGVPGWWPDNERERFYENTDYFRRGRRD